MSSDLPPSDYEDNDPQHKSSGTNAYESYKELARQVNRSIS